MSKRLHFFATGDDLRFAVEIVEGTIPIDYVFMEAARTKAPKRYGSILEVPDLGRSATDSTSTSDEYLVVRKGQQVAVRAVKQDVGGVLYFLDQLENPATVTFVPGGLWGEHVLLHGRVATVHDDPTSKALMNLFAKAMRKSFSKVKAFWVGPEAGRLLDAGRRLTPSARASTDIDLTRSA